MQRLVAHCVLSSGCQILYGFNALHTSVEGNCTVPVFPDTFSAIQKSLINFLDLSAIKVKLSWLTSSFSLSDFTLLVSYVWQQPEQMNILETEAFTTGKTSSLYLLIVIFLTLDPLASVARNHRDEFIYQMFYPLCSFMGRASTEFIFNLATFPPLEPLPTLRSAAPAVRSHPHFPSGVAARSSLWLCGSGLYKSYFCYFFCWHLKRK